MSAHLPLPVRTDTNGVGRADFAAPIQHCIKMARRYEKISNAVRLTGPIGSIMILFLLGLWDPEKGASFRNMAIYYGNMVIALIIGLAAALNEHFLFQRQAGKYQAARRVLSNMNIMYKAASEENKSVNGYINKLILWARQNLSEIERLLDDHDVYDLEKSFSMSDPPKSA